MVMTAAKPRRDNAGILRAERLHARLNFRRLPARPPLDDLVEHYWLIDWRLDTPHDQYVVPHPCVNVVWQSGVAPIVVGVESGLSHVRLRGTGRVFGVQFRPGGFRPFTAGPVSRLNDRREPLHQQWALPHADLDVLVCGDADDQVKASAVDDYLQALPPSTVSEATRQAMRLAHQVRTDRTLLRVEELARHARMSTRALQRLFADHVGVGPKWVIRRYRIHEAIERAGGDINWAALAADLGYADQAHLVRDFTAATGTSPAAYARTLAA
jgi:AraC-like DNA-binding protein